LKKTALHGIDIYRQMGTILMGIQADGCAFPDMKNSNWLIDNKGVLHLADAKSFIYTNNGKIDSDNTNKKWADILDTGLWNPSDFNEVGVNYNYPADKLHSYILGKNLYQYLTKCDVHDFEQYRGAGFDFSNKIFKTDMGKKLMLLIINLTDENIQNRMGLQEAVKELLTLQYPDFKKCSTLFTKYNFEAIKKAESLPSVDFSPIYNNWQKEIFNPEKAAELPLMKEKLNQIHEKINKCIPLLKKLQKHCEKHPERQELKEKYEDIKVKIKHAKTPGEIEQINVEIKNILKPNQKLTPSTPIEHSVTRMGL
jgi:hypothetical protein